MNDQLVPSTTTISTIAINSGHRSTIVVALLKSIGYISLRIDDMQPRMLELGDNIHQTKELLTVHNDLISKLKNKEDQVEELLARADNLVTQQKEPDVHVYEAMAESLGFTWKELNRQLQMRGFLLTETLRFHELVAQYEILEKQIQTKLRAALEHRTNDDVQSVQRLIDELTDITALAVGSGADVITQIRVLGAMSDNVQSSQETVNACLQIEEKMLKLASNWELLDEMWRKEYAVLQTNKLDELSAQISEIQIWLDDAQMQSVEKAEDINALLQIAFKKRAMLKHIKELIDSDGGLMSLLDPAISLHDRLEQFIDQIKVEKSKKDKVIAWIASANTMLNQLKAMESDMRNANEAMVGELAPLARQKAQLVIDDGQRLSHLDSQIMRFISEIDKILKRIDQLANERLGRAPKLALYREQIDRLETWLTQIETSLSSSGRIGSSINDASEFCALHKRITTEIMSRETEVNALCNQMHEMSDGDQQRLREFRERFEILKQNVDARVNLGSSFLQLHKFAKELESSFESLDALLTSNRNLSNEKLMTQMKEVFRMIEETLMQEKHQGDKFIESAKSVGHNDCRLNVEDAIDSTMSILGGHKRRFHSINENWNQWQSLRIEERKVIRIVEEVQMWQEETVEIISTMDSKLSSMLTLTEKEKARNYLDEIIERFEEQNRKIIEAENVKLQIEDNETTAKIKVTKQRQNEIRESLTRLREKIDIREEVSFKQSEEIKAPEIVSHLRDSQVDEGEQFEFSAKINGQPTPTINWFKDGRDVKDNIDYRTAFINGNATLTIEETFIEDSAIYTLRAKNDAGVAESSAKLIVKSRSEMESRADQHQKPKFIRQLRNIGVHEGDQATLDCVLVALPEPKVTWYKEEEAIKESERITLRFDGDHCSLMIRDTVANDSGLYTVKATNSVGEATNFCRLTVQSSPESASVQRKLVAPAFTLPLTNKTVTEGDRTILEAKVIGEPKPRVSWKFNDNSLPTSLTTEQVDEWCRLVIEETNLANTGMYTIIAENEAGEARTGATLNIEQRKRDPIEHHRIVSEGFWSDTALMSSPTPPPVPRHRYIEEFREKKSTEFEYSPTATQPEFIRPFQNEYTVTEGEKVKMDCLMIGNPRPKISWYLNNKVLNVNSKFCTLTNIGDTYSLILEPARMDHAGIYRMTAENVRGQTESVFVLKVIPRMQRPYITEHTRVTEEFGAYDYMQRIPDEKISKQHFVSDMEISDDGQRRTMMKQHHTARLSTPPPAKKQQLLTTTHSQENKIYERVDVSSRENLGKPPHFTRTLVSQVAVCGERAVFEGLVTGWPTPEISWTKDGMPVSGLTHPELTFSFIGGRISLLFPVTKVEYSGKYMCTAKNSSGVATSSAQLVVRPKTVAPDFVNRLISQEVAEGDRLVWSVRVTGDPKPTVAWLRDGQVIPNCDEVNIIDDVDGTHTMVVVKTELADSGQFTCLAENVAGEARSTADLVVRPMGTEPGKYFHVTKVTQEKQVKGQQVNRNETFAIENPSISPIT